MARCTTPVAKFDYRVGSHPVTALGRVKHRDVPELAPGAKLQGELVTPENDSREDAGDLPGAVGESNEAAIANENVSGRGIIRGSTRLMPSCMAAEAFAARFPVK